MGVIFYILLSGNSPFNTSSPGTTLEQNMDCKIDYSNTAISGSHPVALGMIKNMLSKNPSKRITASEALNQPLFSGSSDLQDIIINPTYNLKALKREGGLIDSRLNNCKEDGLKRNCSMKLSSSGSKKSLNSSRKSIHYKKNGSNHAGSREES